jgi:hypothetical protein
VEKEKGLGFAKGGSCLRGAIPCPSSLRSICGAGVALELGVSSTPFDFGSSWASGSRSMVRLGLVTVDAGIATSLAGLTCAKG